MIGASAIRFGSVCSGIEAASVAWNPLGWHAAWFAEIEAFPSAVLAHHYPDVPNYGDMTALPERIRSGEVEAPDVLCGGTPCQAFSVAGKRESLSDDRGNLSLVFCEAADAVDDVRLGRGDGPAVVFWENVPGVLSTADNAFGCFLGRLSGECVPLVPPGGRWSDAGVVVGPRRTLAWRILDAQFFGLAQRRERVFVVASARERLDPVAVLLVESRLLGNPAAREGPSEGVAAGAAECFGGGRTGGALDVATACNTRGGERLDFDTETLVVAPLVTDVRGLTDGRNAPTLRAKETANDYTPIVTYPVAVSPTLRAGGNATGGDRPPGTDVDTCDSLIPVVAGIIKGAAIGREPENGPQHGETLPDGPTFTLNCTEVHAVAVQEGARDGGAQAVAVPMMATGREGANSAGIGRDGDPAMTLDTHGAQAVATNMAIRRLLPVECARLQGFPDDYLDIEYRGKPAADGPKYRALGNSWAVNVVRWIGRRMDAEMQRANGEGRAGG